MKQKQIQPIVQQNLDIQHNHTPIRGNIKIHIVNNFQIELDTKIPYINYHLKCYCKNESTKMIGEMHDTDY